MSKNNSYFHFRAEILEICTEYEDRQLSEAVCEAVVMYAIYGLDTKFAEPNYIEAFSRCKKYVNPKCAK